MLALMCLKCILIRTANRQRFQCFSVSALHFSKLSSYIERKLITDGRAWFASLREKTEDAVLAVGVFVGRRPSWQTTELFYKLG